MRIHIYIWIYIYSYALQNWDLVFIYHKHFYMLLIFPLLRNLLYECHHISFSRFTIEYLNCFSLSCYCRNALMWKIIANKINSIYWTLISAQCCDKSFTRTVYFQAYHYSMEYWSTSNIMMLHNFSYIRYFSHIISFVQWGKHNWGWGSFAL